MGLGTCHAADARLVLQVVFLPWLAADMARELPAEAYMRWVDGIIISFLSGSGVCLATASHNASTVSGPPFWILLLYIGAIAGGGLALLMVVMRRLLVQASTLRGELDVVI